METEKDRKLLAIVFTDIEGFSAITQKDEETALRLVQRYRDTIIESTEKYRGKIVNFYGDGSLSVHQSTLDAVNSAIAIQSIFAIAPSIPVRIGIDLGEVVMTHDTIYGNAVNIASRLQQLGRAHSILISGTVAKELGNHPNIQLSLIGQEFVKNIKEPVNIHAICNMPLVVPTKKDIHQGTRRQNTARYVVFLLVSLVVLGVIFRSDFGDFIPWSTSILDKRIMVLPFKNNSGNSSLSDFSPYMAAYLSNLLEEAEEIKLVSLQNIISQPQFESLGFTPYSSLIKKTSAENFIDGYYTHLNDSTLLVTAALIDGNTGEYIKQFPEQSLDLKNLTSGLLQLSQQIVGFLISADFHPISVPTQDAFRAYLEAKRIWGVNDYQDSRRYLQLAIEYDSTFIDAYYELSDTYYNTGAYRQADSILRIVRDQFNIVTQNSTQKNNYYFYTALHNGNNAAAFRYLLNDYNKDREDLFRNTTTASFSLYFVNDPRLTIKILKIIPYSKIDLEFPDNRLRITMGVQAYCALRKYKKAVTLANLYPSQGMIPEHHKMRIRAFAGLMDTASIDKEILQVKLNSSSEDYADILHWTSQQFILHHQTEIARKYLNYAYVVVIKDSIQTNLSAKVMYDMGYLKEGLDHALSLYHFAPYYAPYVSLPGIGYAKMGLLDSANIFLHRLQGPDIKEYYFGEAEYQEAVLLLAIGHKEDALIKLNAAINHGAIFYKESMEFDPGLMSVFDDPDFQKIIHPN
ncbi:MAG: adenylate/guanylate cyclase domain-containing protein [Saprospiraceae bacterium]|nr:adenylate/guanylate cyclase domain-containing protein [Saprospiraceae bacterium]